MFILSRKKFLIIGFSVFLFYFLLNKLSFFIGAEYAEGRIVYFAGNKNPCPVVKFQYRDTVYTFTGDQSFDDYTDKKVEVIFKKDNPLEAKIYSFFGFWWTGIIYGLLPLLIVAAFLLSYLEKDEILVLNYSKYFRSKKARHSTPIKMKKIDWEKFNGLDSTSENTH